MPLSPAVDGVVAAPAIHARSDYHDAFAAADLNARTPPTAAGTDRKRERQFASGGGGGGGGGSDTESTGSGVDGDVRRYIAGGADGAVSGSHLQQPTPDSTDKWGGGGGVDSDVLDLNRTSQAASPLVASAGAGHRRKWSSAAAFEPAETVVASGWAASDIALLVPSVRLQ